VMLIKACCGAGNIDEAMAFFRQIPVKGNGCDHTALSSLLLACARTQRVTDALEVVGRMRQLGVAPNHMTMPVLVKMLGRARMPDEAEALVATSQRELGVKPNLQVYTSLIQALAHNKLGHRVLDVFSQMVSAGIEPDALTLATIMQGCINLGLFDQALTVVRQSSVRFQPEVLQNLLEAMRYKGCQTGATELEALMSNHQDQERASRR